MTTFASRRVRAGTAMLATGLIFGVVPGVATPTAAGAKTAISLRSNHRVYVAGNRVVLKTHLGAANQPITYYEAYRGRSSHVILKSRTDGAGNSTISGRARYSATYTVVYSGDSTHAAARASTRISVRVAMSIKASGGAKRTGYRLYRQSKKAVVATSVAPSKTGRRVLLRLQVRRSGKYRTLDTRRYTLRKGSAVAVTYRGTAGKRYRVRAEYAGDTLNARNHTTWVYSRFRR